MQLIGIDTEKAYHILREKIITLDLAPGSLINEQELVQELDFGSAPIREALKLLIHDKLIVISKHQGLYVAEINPQDLKALSELRVLLESYAARLAAERVKEDNLVVMDALIEEQKNTPKEDKQAWFEIDHKLHQEISQAAHNPYLTQSLDYYFGLSQRLWYVVLPKIEFLSSAVKEHIKLVDSIRKNKPELAERLMSQHVQGFYDKVQEILEKINND